MAPAVPVNERTQDALARCSDGVHTAKCNFLPHINTVIAGRGDNLFAVALFSALLTATPRDFDNVVEMMSQLLEPVRMQTMAVRKQMVGIERFEGAEVVVVGWSPALKRMEGVRWTRWPNSSGFEVKRVGRALMLPDAEWPNTPDVPDTDEKMERIAREQVAYVKRRFPAGQFVCGGSLLITEITPDAMAVRNVCDLDKPASSP
jgi:hypothetical protein